MAEEYESLRKIGLIFLIALTIGSIFEVSILAYGFFNADKVVCNLLWCSFTLERGISTRECFVNGAQVNCSEFPGDEHFCYNGKCEISGVK